MFKLLLLILITFPLYAQEWTDISPFNDNSVHISGSFISSEIGWIIDGSYNNGREIYYTIDSGDNWEEIYSFNEDLEPISSILMSDQLNGWVTLSNDYYAYDHFYKTNDGGYSWEDMTEYVPDIDNITAYHFENANEGFIATFVYSRNSSYIYKTEDGGFTWESFELPPYASPGYHYYVLCFDFLNDSIGWAGCNTGGSIGGILQTTNSGETWESLVEADEYPVESVVDISFASEQIGAVVCYGCIWPYSLISFDNFDNFEWLDVPIISNSLSFQNNTTLWIGGYFGDIFRTTDLGETFNQMYSTSDKITDIQFFDNIGYFFSDDNTLLRFIDQEIGSFDSQLPNNDFQMNTYPNPFNPILTVNYSIPSEINVSIEIYNALGQKIKTFSQISSGSGDFTLIWDGKDENNNQVSSGLYFVNLISDSDIKVIKKCVLIK